MHATDAGSAWQEMDAVSSRRHRHNSRQTERLAAQTRRRSRRHDR
jgi:hypothetical protein